MILINHDYSMNLVQVITQLHEAKSKERKIDCHKYKNILLTDSRKESSFSVNPLKGSKEIEWENNVISEQ
jgi:hypothetical protein